MQFRIDKVIQKISTSRQATSMVTHYHPILRWCGCGCRRWGQTASRGLLVDRFGVGGVWWYWLTCDESDVVWIVNVGLFPPLVAKGGDVHVCALTHSPWPRRLHSTGTPGATLRSVCGCMHVMCGMPWCAVLCAAPRCCRWGRVGGILDML